MEKTPETLRIQLRKWQFKAKSKPNRFYFYYFIFVICLAYIIESIAIYINGVVQQDVIGQFFGGLSEADQSTRYNIMLTVCSSASVLTFFYKALSDKYGRKPFLVINIFGLAFGMFICFLAKNVGIFAIGCFIMYFFTPAHMEELYIIETCSPKHRGFWLAFSKAFGIMGIALVSFLRKWAINQTPSWQYVFLIPACIGCGVAIVCLLLVDESPVFVQNKINYYKSEIRKLEYPLEVEDKKTKYQLKQGGILTAIKYMFYDKSLLWLFVVGIIFTISSVAVTNYTQIIADSATTSTNMDTILIIFPFTYAFVELVIGIISDKIGRIRASILSSAITLLGFLLFVVGNKMHWSEHFLGALLGAFIGGYMVSLDLYNIVCAEKSPTNLRGSILSVVNISYSAGGLIATGLLIVCQQFIKNMDIGYFALIAIVPALFISLLILISKIPETKDMLLVTKIKIGTQTLKKVNLKNINIKKKKK